MKAALDGDDTRATGCRTADLDRRLDRLRARAREEHTAEPRRCALEERFREQAPERVDAERELSRCVERQRFDERRSHTRVVAADVVHPEPAEPVEIPVSIGVIQVRALCPSPAPVEADRLQHPHVLRVDRTRMELERVASARLQQLRHAEVGHARSVAPVRSGPETV